MEPYEELSRKAWSIWQHHIPQNIFFRKLSVIVIEPWPCWQQDSLLLTGPGIYPQVYYRTSCPAVLICKGSSKKQRSSRIIWNFTKGETFSSHINQVIILQCGPPSCALPKKTFPRRFGQEENLSGNSIERRVYWFILKIC